MGIIILIASKETSKVEKLNKIERQRNWKRRKFYKVFSTWKIVCFLVLCSWTQNTITYLSECVQLLIRVNKNLLVSHCILHTEEYLVLINLLHLIAFPVFNQTYTFSNLYSSREALYRVNRESQMRELRNRERKS